MACCWLGSVASFVRPSDAVCNHVQRSCFTRLCMRCCATSVGHVRTRRVRSALFSSNSITQYSSATKAEGTFAGDIVRQAITQSDIIIDRCLDMAVLPLEVLLQVATYFETEDLLAAAAVCKSWRFVINGNPCLWHHPHIIIRICKFRRVVDYKPSLDLLAERLRGNAIKSLYLSESELGTNLRRGFFFKLGTDPVRSFTGYLFQQLPPVQAPQPFHLKLHLVVLQDLEDFAHLVSYIVPISNLSVSSHQFLHTIRVIDMAMAAMDKFPGINRLDVLGDTCRAVTMYGVGLPFLESGTPQERIVAEVRYYDLRAIPPDALARQSSSQYLSRLTRGERCLVQGASWAVHEVAPVAGLEYLKCQSIWNLECSVKRRHFRDLRCLSLSFHPSATLKWFDLARFVGAAMGPQLQILELHFPVVQISSDSKDNRGVFDKAFSRGVRLCSKLKTVRMTNHIPGNLSVLGEQYSVRQSLETLILENAVLPQNFLRMFTPEYFPSLRIFDLSTTSFMPRTTEEDGQKWNRLWSESSLVRFYPPRSRPASALP